MLLSNEEVIFNHADLIEAQSARDNCEYGSLAWDYAEQYVEYIQEQLDQ